MAVQFFSSVRTLTNDNKVMFPGMSGVNILEATVKCRSNGLTLLSNIDEIDGFRVDEGASFDIIEKAIPGESYNLNKLYWKNTVIDSNCVVEIFGQRRV